MLVSEGFIERCISSWGRETHLTDVRTRAPTARTHAQHARNMNTLVYCHLKLEVCMNTHTHIQTGNQKHKNKNEPKINLNSV